MMSWRVSGRMPYWSRKSALRECTKSLAACCNKGSARALLAARNPQQRMIQPEEVAQTVVWLCQRSSGGINGQTIALDGGELAG
mgnify:CR=1 FL=1